ncbi:MAG: MFS transporter [Lachnospiraceae bacterium]|nr:MFS transporter [Lachnospiraceae bacterium]
MHTRRKYKKTLLACYLSFVTQAICANFLPLLYMTFHEDYGLSFGNLAVISAVFFLTQLVVDFICAKAVDKIGYRPCIITSEIACGVGLAGLSILPDVTPTPFLGILICVIVYAIGSGLIEVLASPIIEACPFDNKESMMSLLHSFYCWGFLGVILLSTLFFTIFGLENWRILACIWALIPIYNIYNFVTCPIEKLVEDGEGLTMGQLLKTKFFWIFIVLMVCAGSSEIAMTQWASAFAESALQVSKTVGDLAGPCGFAICMGISRILYGKFGEKVDLSAFMIFSGILCVGCYLLAGLGNAPALGLIGCALCGFSVGIMWPGSISVASKTIPKGGTAMFALLALAGDLGGTVAPTLVGNISQMAGDNLKAGILAGIVFPIGLVLCVLAIRRIWLKAMHG